MARKQLNSYQLELRSKENTGRVKRVEALNKCIFTLAEQSEHERKRRLRLTLEQKLARKPQENTSQEVIKFPDGRISYLEGLFLGIIIGLLFSWFIDFAANRGTTLNTYKTLLTSTSFRYHQMSSSETPAVTVDEDELADPNFDGYFNDKEHPPYNAEDPYSYAPPHLPQNEQEVRSAVEDITQKLGA
jgi:hypothetical protein